MSDESRGEAAAEAVEVVRVELEVPAELYRRALALAEEEDWPRREALLTALSHGVACLEGEDSLAALDRGEADPRAEAERFRRMAMGLQGAYSVMKFRAWELGERVKTLEMNVSGLRADNRLAHHRLQMFRQEEQRLRAELATLRTENAELRARLEAAEAAHPASTPPSPPAGPLARLRRWLAGT